MKAGQLIFLALGYSLLGFGLLLVFFAGYPIQGALILVTVGLAGIGGIIYRAITWASTKPDVCPHCGNKVVPGTECYDG